VPESGVGAKAALGSGRHTGRSRLIRALAAVALVAVAAAVAALLLAGNGSHRYTLLFETGGQLVKGNQVRVGGHPVGSVQGVSLTDDGLAAVEVSIDQRLHAGTTAVIRANSLVGIANRYISLSPGPNSEPELESGTTVGTEATTSPVDFDQLLNAFDARARRGLGRFIRGQGAIYAGMGEEANESYRYLEPALSEWDRVLAELNADQRLFERFVTSSAKLFTEIAERGEDLTASIASGRVAFEAIARENRSLNRSLELIPPTFRQANTTFVNLRAAFDDLDPLVETAKPATRELASFMRRLRPVVSGSVPLFRDLRLSLNRPGQANDLGYLIPVMPRVQQRAHHSFRDARRAIADFQPTLDFARPYSEELTGSLTKLGQITGFYDSGGNYARAGLSNLNLFEWSSGSGALAPIARQDQYAPFGTTFEGPRPCPGGTTQPAPDNSNPFVDPPWPFSGLAAGADCDPGGVPPGP
jgi:phospholipid/cholesterol/gamma-HCH transport system substrate-binding protein